MLKDKSEIVQKIIVVVTNIQLFECVLTTSSSLLRNGKLLKSTERFNTLNKLHEDFKDVIL